MRAKGKLQQIEDFNQYLTNRFWNEFDRLNFRFPIHTSKGIITDVVKTKAKGVWQCINAGGGRIAFKLLNRDEFHRIANRIRNN